MIRDFKGFLRRAKCYILHSERWVIHRGYGLTSTLWQCPTCKLVWPLHRYRIWKDNE